MKLVSLTLNNFRCYQDEITINFGDLTTFIGKNDIGKSTVLEALEIFFNNETVKIEIGDANIFSGHSEVSITCEFTDLPESLTIDESSPTTLKEEYLLNSKGNLEIKKVYSLTKSTPSCDVYIIAEHPTKEGANNLLELKEKDLQALIAKNNISAPLKGNPIMRKAIWLAHTDLEIKPIALQVSKLKEDGKRIWDKIDSHLPIYSLFQSDRNSQDKDKEVQDPMKNAISAAIAEVTDDLMRIQQKVRERAEDIAAQTLEALKSIDPKLANKLEPNFNPPTAAKWTSLFSINMDTDEGIPLNKRGSGVRRMILVSFFKAAAERRLLSSNKRSIIYALEEPETAQHPNNQKVLIDAFRTLAEENDCQVILTTHSPGLASELPSDSIRFIDRDEMGRPHVLQGVDVFGRVAETLGVIPDSRVKLLICVEGPTDVTALKCLSKALAKENSGLLDLSADPRIAFVLMGGSTLKHWVNEQYLRGLGYPEVHIYDNDVPEYQNSINMVNSRTDGSWGVLTSKYEIESYLHPDAIEEAFGVRIQIPEGQHDQLNSVPKLFAKSYSEKKKFDGVMKDNRAKTLLAEKAFPLMDAQRIKEIDHQGEILSWLIKISNTINQPT